MKKQSIMSKFFCIFSFLVFSLFSCELLTGPKVDLLSEISKEVDWANAKKLTVRIDYPSAWGTSNPPQGSITPARDIRKGYEFSVEFTPDTAYTLQSWMVILTSELDALTDSGSWVDSPGLITDTDKIHPLGPDEVTLPAPVASGGTFKFTILTTEPVTLVPWCDTQPRITRTEPRNRPNGLPYSRASDIVLFFNSALNDKTVKFANSEIEDGIWITAESGNSVTTNKEKNWFYEPEYAIIGGFFTVTIRTSANLPPQNSLMTVTVKGIKNVEGESMDKAGYSFSWNTSLAVDVKLTSYTAAYANGKIDISWTTTGADTVVTYYRLNSGANIPLTNAADKASITGVNAINDSGVRGGRQISGIEEYTIFIELYAEEIMENRVIFKIWNFPGMSVSNTNSAIEVSTAAQLAAMKDNLGGQYVLVSDINITGDWTPIGKFDIAKPELSFRGKLYGNGHTITLNGGFGGELCYGLFGCAQNAVIRDFTLEYKKPSPITPSFGSFSLEIQGEVMTGEGIIIGSVAGFLIKTEVCNIITSGGTFAIEAPSASADVNMVALGGIAGFIEGEGRIVNCRAALSVAYTSKGHKGEVNIGAVAGMSSKALLSTPVPGRPGLILNGVTVAANVGADKGLYDGRIDIGGAFGGNEENTLNDITFTAGTVSFSKNSKDETYCGGILGSSTKTNLEGCSFFGNIKGNVNAVSGGTGFTRIGGLIAQNDDGNPYNPSDAPGEYYIKNCMVGGNIELNGSSNAEIIIGGIMGCENNYFNSKIEITNCFFENGNITVKDMTAPIFSVGGSFGDLNGSHIVNNCGTRKGTITIDNADGAIQVGGFTSSFIGTIAKVFSLIDIIVESKNSRICNVGGFTGSLQDGNINECYATGTVSVVTESSPPPSLSNIIVKAPSVGGLVGIIYNNGTVNNSYALGNVQLSDSGNNFPAAAGGLVGYNQNADISNCFSAGQVGAQSVTVAYSGGIVGNNNNGTITNTAALGASVTALGGTKATGRIYGFSTTALDISAKNYALKTMSVEEDVYNSTSPAASTTLEIGLNAKDGGDSNSSTFLSQVFWKTTLGFSSTIWDFNSVARDGYPRLKGVNGQ